MRLIGNMTITLTDKNTGEVETVAEENMVTNAVNNIGTESIRGVL